MRILHYTIGFSPERSGGLSRYSTDLMKEQARQGNNVFALYPGRVNIFKRKSYFKQTKRSNLPSVTIFEIINSLPLPLFGGIKNPEDFMGKVDNNFYKDFFNKINPDVIHVHTLMGLHKEFFEAAKEKDLRIVFTSHDYFGLSPVPDFYLNGKSWDNDNTNEFWNECAENAMPTNKLRVFQLSYYPKIREVVNRIKGSREGQLFRVTTDLGNRTTSNLDFSGLKKYYQSIFRMIDKFHFNSDIAKSVFSRNLTFLEEKQTEVISITNDSIENHCDTKKNQFIKTIAYIGPYQENKGFLDFLKFAEKYKDSEYSFQIYGGSSSYSVPSWITNNGRYSDSDRKKIFCSIDLLLVPSRWKETFGFLTLEALSYGTPVMVSENVGSKMILDHSKVFTSLENLKIPRVIEQNPVEVKMISDHAKEIVEFYKK